MRRIVAGAAAVMGAAGMTLGLTIGAASAAPITCPGNQTAVKTGPGTWVCQTSSGNDTSGGSHKGTGTKIFR